MNFELKEEPSLKRILIGPSAVRLEAENRLSELEQQKTLRDTAGHAHREEWEERLRGAQLGEESARKELQNLRSGRLGLCHCAVASKSISFLFVLFCTYLSSYVFFYTAMSVVNVLENC